MQDLKTGHLIHASPRAQFYGQLVGSALSILVTTTAYTFYTRAYAIPGPEFPTPTAYVSLLVVHRTFCFNFARRIRCGSASRGYYVCLV